MSNLCIIPARGGSKRIPRKNVRPFAGRPMLHWPVRAARETGLFGRIVVSTDDPEIADVAREAGAEVLDRPKAIADDRTPLRPVIRHAIEASAPGTIERVCCILATAVLADSADIARGHAALDDGGIDFAFAAAPFPAPPHRALLREGKGVAMMFPEHRLTRTQDLPEAFFDVGQFYWGRPGGFATDASMFEARSRMVVVPPERARDIDTPEDWAAAERLFAALRDVPGP